MIRIIALLCGVFGSFSSHCFSWSDLWFTADQQGQHSMSKANYRKAQQQFERRDWAATAAYRAGDYEMAAQLFQQKASADDYYNHGNALAHLGQYEQALKAYNQALKLNSQHGDARFNHKLISDLLKKDQEKKQNKDQDKQDKDKQDKDKQDKDEQDKDKQDKDEQDKEEQDKDKQDKEEQDKDKQDKDKQDKDKQDKDKQDKDKQDKDKQDKDKQDKDKQDKEEQDKDKQDKEEQKSEAQRAAEKEKEQAKQQWLRLIPDDPGGLIREKFLRDHIRRERGWYQ